VEPDPKLVTIDIGDSLPVLTLKNEKDEDVDISTLTADKGLVLFLVPKADTREFPRYSLSLLKILDLSGMHYPSLWFPGHIPRLYGPGLQCVLPQRRHSWGSEQMADKGTRPTPS
jgi:hypothetical protein